MKILTLLAFIIFPSISYATELIMTQEQAEASGFQPFDSKSRTLVRSEKINIAIEEIEELDWPFEQPYSRGFLGNNFLQYQPYGPAGYHSGTDMILERDSWVLAPTNGILEAGHYTYVHNEDGSREKFWKPWPESGDENYFELAVTDGNGYRYELHHVAKTSMPQSIINGLNSGNEYSVSAGERLAKVVRWSTFFHYDHVHLNVYSPEGNELNPERFFKPLMDNIAPDVKFVAKFSDQSTKWLREGTALDKDVIGFYIIGADQKNSSIWQNAVQEFTLEVDGQIKESINFDLTHSNEFGDWYDIRDVYPRSLTLPNGSIIRQPTSYYPRKNTEFITQINTDSIDFSNSDRVILVARDSNNNATTINVRFVD